MSPENQHSSSQDNPENNRDDELDNLWEKSKKSQSKVSVSKEEKQQALSHVLSEIEEKEQEEQEPEDSPNIQAAEHPSSKHSALTYFSVAAAILIGIGISYLNSSQIYSTSAGQMQTITLADKSQVHINAESELKVPHYFGWFSRSVELEGEAYFEVETNDQPFNVQTPNAAVEVLGTSFNVRTRPVRRQYKTTVSVVEGIVRLQLIDRSEQITLDKNKSASVFNRSLKTEQMDTQQAAAWKSGDINFYDQSLPSIFSEIERRFNVTIEYPKEELYSLRLNAFYSDPQSAENIIQDICLAKGLRYRPTNNGFEIYKDK